MYVCGMWLVLVGVDDSYCTTVQGDGCILSTPTGVHHVVAMQLTTLFASIYIRGAHCFSSNLVSVCVHPKVFFCWLIFRSLLFVMYAKNENNNNKKNLFQKCIFLEFATPGSVQTKILQKVMATEGKIAEMRRVCRYIQ